LTTNWLFNARELSFFAISGIQDQINFLNRSSSALIQLKLIIDEKFQSEGSTCRSSNLILSISPFHLAFLRIIRANLKSKRVSLFSLKKR